MGLKRCSMCQAPVKDPNQARMEPVTGWVYCVDCVEDLDLPSLRVVVACITCGEFMFHTSPDLTWKGSGPQEPMCAKCLNVGDDEILAAVQQLQEIQDAT